VSLLIPSFGRTIQRLAARSHTALIQAARALPALPAAPSQSVLRPLDKRSSYRSSSGLATGGRPTGRLDGFMGGSLGPYKYLDKW
jgi:hypothetical protein